MPPSNPVVSGATVVAGLRGDFKDAYGMYAPDENSRLNMVMDLNVPSGGQYEIYGYYESAPYPVRRPRGQGISFANYLSRNFTIYNFEYSRGVKWHKHDRADDRTHSLVDQARKLGQHYATLAERIFFQMVLGATDADLLPSVPNAPDGAAFFATVDGASAARFGATDGNLLTGTGVATSDAIRNDVYSAIEQFRLFQDTEAEPLWAEEICDVGYLVIHGAHLQREMDEALSGTAQQRIVQNVAGAENVAVSSISNTLLETGRKFATWSTQRISTNDIYVFMKGTPVKPTFRQVREDIQEYFKTCDNAESPLETGEEYIAWESRYGFGQMLPYGAVMIDN